MMAYSNGDTITRTNIMYRAEVQNAIEAINDQQSSQDLLNAYSLVCSALALLISPPLAIATGVTLLLASYTTTKCLNEIEDLEDAYTNIYFEMTRSTNPVLYIEVKQTYTYISKGSNHKGWIQKGSPVFARHYTDY